MSDVYAPARMTRLASALLLVLALVSLSGLVPALVPAPLPAGDYSVVGLGPRPADCFEASDRPRVQVAAVLGTVLLGLAWQALRVGQRGVALELAAVTMPFLLIRSKWAMLLGAVALFTLLAEALFHEGADGSAPPPFRMRILAGAAAATVAWIVYLGGLHTGRAVSSWVGGLTIPMTQLCAFGLQFFVCYQWVCAALEWRFHPRGGEPLRLAGLGASVALYALLG